MSRVKIADASPNSVSFATASASSRPSIGSTPSTGRKKLLADDAALAGDVRERGGGDEAAAGLVDVAAREYLGVFGGGQL
jgi:hypothetical protein